jgi:hypothetical protein
VHGIPLGVHGSEVVMTNGVIRLIGLAAILIAMLIVR